MRNVRSCQHSTQYLTVVQILPTFPTSSLMLLCGVDASGKTVPDPLLSEVEKYGVAFRPRQTMFEDVKEARRELAFTLNEILADIKLSL